MKKLISFILTINILMLMIPSAITRFANVCGINEKLLGYSVKGIFLSLVCILLVFSVNNNYDEVGSFKLYLNTRGFICFLMMIVIFVVTSRINSQPIMWRLSGYFLFLVAMIVASVGNNNITFSSTGMYWGILMYTIPSAIIGIMQYITTKPIVPVVNQLGESSVATTQLNSVSSLGFLGNNGGYRAFGMFDSGMSLGLFLLLSMAVLFFADMKINSLIKFALELLFTVTIIMTLTRNIYFLYVLLIMLRFIRSIKAKTKLFILGVGLQVLTIALANALNTLSFFQSDFFGTLRARFRGLIFFEGYYNQNLVSLLFGRGYQYDAVVKTVTANMVDNQMLAIFLDIGILGVILVYTWFFCLMKIDKIKTSNVLQNMVVLFAFFGIANNHIVFFSGILLLSLLYAKSTNDRLMIEEE